MRFVEIHGMLHVEMTQQDEDALHKVIDDLNRKERSKDSSRR